MRRLAAAVIQRALDDAFQIDGVADVPEQMDALDFLMSADRIAAWGDLVGLDAEAVRRRVRQRVIRGE